ncbi:MAG: helix-hairpin-helix domain-containing protein [Polyangiaceae bacterium]
MTNDQITQIFEEFADRLELSGESSFKTRAFRTFAKTVAGLTEPLEDVVARGALGDLPGVGKGITALVAELLAKGTFEDLERTRAEIPDGVLDLMKVPGLGPKGVRTLWQSAGITTLGELAYACEENRLAALPGFGKKKQAKIFEAVLAAMEGSQKLLLAVAKDLGAVVEETLAESGATRTAVVGATRRGAPVVDAIVVLCEGLDKDGVATALRLRAADLALRTLSFATETGSEGEGVTFDVHGGGRGRVRIVAPEAWVATLLAETGSDEHVRGLEARAKELGTSLADVAREARDETAVYARLRMSETPPELREARASDVPPKLVAERAVRGVFHVHTDWSDGYSSIVEMAKAAEEAGFTYLGISDHSQAASYANGLSSDRLADQAAAIQAARAEVPGVRLFHGIEVDILGDGSLDLPDETLASLDFVIASVHSKFAMTEEEMTARIVRAVSHPLVTVLGHPTGRLLLGRKGYTFDLVQVARAAAANDTYLEINANPHRLDLSDDMVRTAAKEGARFAINPDAHAMRGIKDTFLGLTVARRAGLEASQILNVIAPEAMADTLLARKNAALGRLKSTRT